MFRNLYGKQLLRTFRDRTYFIWLLLFPVLLSTLFYFTFSSLDEANALKTFDVALVVDDSYEAGGAFDQALASVSETEATDALFALEKCDSQAAADALLKAGEVYGYYYMEASRPKLVVASSGMYETIMKSFLDQYVQTENTIETVLRENPGAMAQLDLLTDVRSYTAQISPSKNAPTDKINYFYALLAMVCMFGSILGMSVVCDLQANLSAQGARRAVSPVRRGKMAAADLLAGITVQVLVICIVILYIRYFLGIDFGTQMLPVIFTGIVGSIVGVAFGALVAVTNKLAATVKSAILISITMVCSFLAGLMVNGINYTVMEKAPVLAWLNPAARITDAFYCLYYYDTYGRYFLNIGILLGMAAVMFAVTALFIRRQQHESI